MGQMLIDRGDHHPVRPALAFLPADALQQSGGLDEAVGVDPWEGTNFDFWVRRQQFHRGIGGAVVEDHVAVHPGIVVTEEERQHIRLVPADGVEMHAHDGPEPAWPAGSTMRAGLPATFAPAGTSCRTTAPGATIAPSPMVVPGPI